MMVENKIVSGGCKGRSRFEFLFPNHVGIASENGDNRSGSAGCRMDTLRIDGPTFTNRDGTLCADFAGGGRGDAVPGGSGAGTS